MWRISTGWDRRDSPSGRGDSLSGEGDLESSTIVRLCNRCTDCLGHLETRETVDRAVDSIRDRVMCISEILLCAD